MFLNVYLLTSHPHPITLPLASSAFLTQSPTVLFQFQQVLFHHVLLVHISSKCLPLCSHWEECTGKSQGIVSSAFSLFLLLSIFLIRTEPVPLASLASTWTCEGMTFWECAGPPAALFRSQLEFRGAGSTLELWDQKRSWLSTTDANTNSFPQDPAPGSVETPL